MLKIPSLSLSPAHPLKQRCIKSFGEWETLRRAKQATKICNRFSYELTEKSPYNPITL